MLPALALLSLSLTPVQQLNADASALSPIVETKLVRLWLSRTSDLREPAPQVLFRNKAGEYLTVPQASALSKEARGDLRRVRLPASFYYTTRYGSPLAYARPLDFAARHGLRDLRGKKILDFGFGTIGHLQLLAHAGVEAHGIEVDSLLEALYSEPGDTGRIGPGSVRLHFGSFPGDAKLGAEVSGRYDLITSKNTLKRGYIHPERPAPKEQLVDLGVSDAAFLEDIHSRLRPGGLFVVYNLSPRPSPLDKPYIPWADGRFPFERALTEKAGFEILAWDQNDLPWAQSMGRALGWDKAGMNLEGDLQAEVTVLRRKR
ncbi:hypothetical protein EON79_11440 [bacterium]|nr:MAG: hypothetical protein EON79_11440 [bacterium]